MISDTLSHAICEMSFYLTTYPETYSGDMRNQILKLTEDMEAMRKELDAPPAEHEKQTPIYLKASLDAFASALVETTDTTGDHP